MIVNNHAPRRYMYGFKPDHTAHGDTLDQYLCTSSSTSTKAVECSETRDSSEAQAEPRARATSPPGPANVS